MLGLTAQIDSDDRVLLAQRSSYMSPDTELSDSVILKCNYSAGQTHCEVCGYPWMSSNGCPDPAILAWISSGPATSLLTGMLWVLNFAKSVISVGEYYTRKRRKVYMYEYQPGN